MHKISKVDVDTYSFVSVFYPISINLFLKNLSHQDSLNDDKNTVKYLIHFNTCEKIKGLLKGSLVINGHMEKCFCKSQNHS